MQLTLRHKINAAIIVTFILIALLSASVRIPFQRHRLDRAIRNVELLLSTLVQRDNEQLANEIFDARVRAVEIRLAQMLAVEGIISISLYGMDGRRTAIQGEALGPVEILPDLRQQLRDRYGVRRTRHWGKGILVFSKKIEFLGEELGFIRIHYSLEQVEQEQEMMFLLSAGLLGSVLLVMLVVLNWILSRAILRPVRDLRDATQYIVQGDLEQDIAMDREDELGQLARSFEKMRDAVKEKIFDLEHLTGMITNIIDSMPSVLIGVDGDLRVTQWNRTAAKTLGIPPDEAVGQALDQLLPDAGIDMGALAKSIRTREILHLPKQVRVRGGDTVYEDVTLYPLISDSAGGAVIRIDDVTEKVRMEEVIVQSEKMLSVGGLAAGMAHEMNNPLAGIIQTASVVSNRLTNTHMPANLRAAESVGTDMETIQKFMDHRGIPKMLDAIRTTGRRAADIVANMLSFARRGDDRREQSAMDELMDRTLDLATADYDLKKRLDFRQVKVLKSYDPAVPPIPCERSKLQQVLLNIIRNGAQAMQAHHTTDPQLSIRISHDREGESVVIEISDNGPGMDEAVRKRVFEPFFTTKPVGIGTGLGLSVSYFIVTEDHGGFMDVVSGPGQGATFIIGLPVK